MSNPFKSSCGYYISADDRLHAVKRFGLEDCRAALNLDGLQKAVINALNRRIKMLEKNNGQ